MTQEKIKAGVRAAFPGVKVSFLENPDEFPGMGAFSVTAKNGIRRGWRFTDDYFEEAIGRCRKWLARQEQ